jgi:hypothetical protein
MSEAKDGETAESQRRNSGFHFTNKDTDKLFMAGLRRILRW